MMLPIFLIAFQIINFIVKILKICPVLWQLKKLGFYDLSL